MRRLAFWLAAFVVFTLPWENILGVPGVGTISRAVGLAAAGVWGLSVLASGSVRRPVAPLLVALAFVVWNGFTVFWSVDVDVSIGRFLTFGQLFVLMYLLWDTVRSDRDLRIVMQAYVLGASITVFTLVRHALLYGPEGYQVRYTVGDFQFDDIGLVFALGIPMAWYLATTPTATRGGRALQVLNVVHVPAAVVGIMFSGSRVAMIAVLPSFVYVLLSLVRLRPRARGIALAGLAGVFMALVQLVPQSTLDRLVSTAGDRTQGDFNGRTELWSQAYLTFQQHPLTGVGTGAFREEATWKVAHNVWLRFAAELGLVGLGLFLLLLFLLLVRAWYSPRPLRHFSITVITVWAIGATFYNAEDKKQTWLILSLVLLAGAIRTERRERATEHAPASGVSGPTPEPVSPHALQGPA
jgi:O-antigen ligase